MAIVSLSLEFQLCTITDLICSITCSVFSSISIVEDTLRLHAFHFGRLLTCLSPPYLAPHFDHAAVTAILVMAYEAGFSLMSSPSNPFCAYLATATGACLSSTQNMFCLSVFTLWYFLLGFSSLVFPHGVIASLFKLHFRIFPDSLP